MVKDICNEFQYEMCFKMRYVRLNDRKKEYIEKFQKAKVDGMILEIGKACNERSDDDF
ncbi:hypothetical protein ACIQZG_15850 [Lysinibacillus sp. NPDC096418]|uniref:hypothetical protein n=1 Tax=Lysinibacillus sp. NPDC096418 TaxID=3364138 RepID=UPI0037FC9EC0